MSGFWNQNPDDLIHGVVESGEEVTLKESLDGSEALIARGHLDDIQPENDHVHVWGQGSDEPGHHDMRWTEPLFDDPSSEANEPGLI